VKQNGSEEKKSRKKEIITRKNGTGKPVSVYLFFPPLHETVQLTAERNIK